MGSHIERVTNSWYLISNSWFHTYILIILRQISNTYVYTCTVPVLCTSPAGTCTCVMEECVDGGAHYLLQTSLPNFRDITICKFRHCMSRECVLSCHLSVSFRLNSGINTRQCWTSALCNCNYVRGVVTFMCSDWMAQAFFVWERHLFGSVKVPWQDLPKACLHTCLLPSL